MVPQPALAPLRRWDPERIGPFVLLGRLGAGAMGQVYLGRSTAGRLVAVKTIKIEFAEEAGFRSRFAHEVAAARRVSGVFTAAVVAADADADVPWLATAYIAAPSLSRLVRSVGPLAVPAVRWLAAGCAEALESIHNAGLVHRDLKPSNVLVSPDGPRVIDFGVARAAERIQLTVTRGALGTPAYMAPEQARDTRQASMASDVFSLGATLLFAATGHPPYQGDTVMDILVRLATEPPDLTGLPPELTSVVTACLERSPRSRPTSAALLAELAPFVGGTPSSPGSGHTYLPASALALIGEYQRSPRPAEPRADQDPDQPQLTDDVSEDATYGSYTALPAPQRSRWPRRRGQPGPGVTGWPPGGAAGRAPGRTIAAAGPGVGRAGRWRRGAGRPGYRAGGHADRRGRPGGRLREAARDRHGHRDVPGAAAEPGPASLDAARRDEHGAQTGDGAALRGWRHGVRGARQRVCPADPGHGEAGRARDRRRSGRPWTRWAPSTMRSTRATCSSPGRSRSATITCWSPGPGAGTPPSASRSAPCRRLLPGAARHRPARVIPRPPAGASCRRLPGRA